MNAVEEHVVSYYLKWEVPVAFSISDTVNMKSVINACGLTYWVSTRKIPVKHYSSKNKGATSLVHGGKHFWCVSQSELSFGISAQSEVSQCLLPWHEISRIPVFNQYHFHQCEEAITCGYRMWFFKLFSNSIGVISGFMSLCGSELNAADLSSLLTHPRSQLHETQPWLCHI